MKERRGQLQLRPHLYDASGCIVKNILLKESLCLVQMLYIFTHSSSSKALVLSVKNESNLAKSKSPLGPHLTHTVSVDPPYSVC